MRLCLIISYLNKLYISNVLKNHIKHVIVTYAITLQLLLPSTLKNMKDLFTSFVLVVGHFVFMFLANYMGQIMTDHCVDIFNAL